MAVGFSNTNKPINPRGNDASPKAFNRSKLYSGKALDFDGVNDFISTGTQSFITASGFSISTYLNIDDNSEHYIFSTGYSNADSLLFYSAASSTTFGVSWYDGSSATLSTAVDYTIGEWFHALITYDGTTLKIYKNGVEVVSEAFAIDNIASGVYEIGWASPRAKSTAYLQGKVGGFKTFNTALTAAQVADLYNNPEKVVPTGVDNTALKLWLPMQEGAGTTAYDGSGNGNHGTISGATYTHGIGAPVSQTAVIDWNKGTNELQYSEEFDNAYWVKSQITVSANTTATLDPISGNNADKAIPSTSSIRHFIDANITGANQTASIFAKADGYSTITLFYTVHDGYATYNLNDGTITETSGSVTATIESFGNGWYRCNLNTSLTTQNSIRFYIINGTTWGSDALNAGDGTSGVYLWGAQVNAGSLGPYVRTGATAQTSPVLLPQGLTTGRDITGVNLFENVRKQGALNLDGNSWAEVHDNESVDVQSFTLECWVNLEFTGTYQEFISKGDSGSDRTFELYLNNTQNRFGVLVNTAGFAFATQTINEGEWYHVVATYDSSNDAVKGYVDSVEKLSTTGSVNPNNTDGDVVIGAWYDKSALKTNGQIAQPRIYNRALTAAEVLQNYNSGKNTYK